MELTQELVLAKGLTHLKYVGHPGVPSMLPEFNKSIEAYGTVSRISPCKRVLQILSIYMGHPGLPSLLPEFNKCIEAYGTDSRISPCRMVLQILNTWEIQLN